MNEKKMNQYCVAVNVWVVAEDAKHAEKNVVQGMNYLCGMYPPIAGFDVLFVDEQKSLSEV